jgi:hypothetical protein
MKAFHSYPLDRKFCHLIIQFHSLLIYVLSQWPITESARTQTTEAKRGTKGQSNQTKKKQKN